MTNPQMISALFDTLLDAATKVGLAAAALFLAWAGFLYMTAVVVHAAWKAPKTPPSPQSAAWRSCCWPTPSPR